MDGDNAILNAGNCCQTHELYKLLAPSHRLFSPHVKAVFRYQMLCIYFNGTQMHILPSIIVMSTGNFLTCYFPPNSYSDRLDILWGQSPRSIYICVPLNTLEIKSVVNVDQEYCKSKRYLYLSPKLHPSRWCLTRKVLISSESGTVKMGGTLEMCFLLFCSSPIPWFFSPVVSSSFLCLLNLTWKYEFRILSLRSWLSDFSVLYCWPQIERL